MTGGTGLICLAVMISLTARVAVSDQDGAVWVYCHPNERSVRILPGTALQCECKSSIHLQSQGKTVWMRGGDILTESTCPHGQTFAPCSKTNSGTLILRSITMSMTISCRRNGISSRPFMVTVNSVTRALTRAVTEQVSSYSTRNGSTSVEVTTVPLTQTTWVRSTPATQSGNNSVTEGGTGTTFSSVDPTTAQVNTTRDQTSWTRSDSPDLVPAIVGTSVGFTVLIILAIAVGKRYYKRQQSRQRYNPEVPETDYSIGRCNVEGGGEEDVPGPLAEREDRGIQKKIRENNLPLEPNHCCKFMGQVVEEVMDGQSELARGQNELLLGQQELLRRIENTRESGN